MRWLRSWLVSGRLKRLRQERDALADQAAQAWERHRRVAHVQARLLTVTEAILRLERWQ